MPLVVAYSSHLPNINKIIREKNNLVMRSERLRHVFDNAMFVSFKRGSNLEDLLVHKKTKRLGQPRKGNMGECGKNYVVCRVMLRSTLNIKGPG